MAALPLIFGAVGKVLDRVIPDKAAHAAAVDALAQLQQSGELQQLHDQLLVDLAEAQSQSRFVAGWRPFVGWVCGFAFAYAFIVQPFLIFGMVFFGRGELVAQLPHLDLSTMMPVLLGMLGLGAMRSYDKVYGTASGH